jgi:TldD protein
MSLKDLKAAEFSELVSGADYGELLFEESSAASIQFEDSRVEDLAASSERGMGLRLLRQSGEAVETLYGSSNTWDPAAAARLRQSLLPGKAAPVAFDAPSRYKHIVRQDPREIPISAKIDLLKSLDKLIRSEFPHIRQVSLSYGERFKSTALLNSEKAFQLEERVSVVLAVQVVAEQGSTLQTGLSVLGGLKGYELFTDEDPARAAREAASRAVAKLSAPKAKAGEMPVVLAASAGGTFIHEAIGHSLEADHVQEGSSPAYKGSLGKVVAPENITVVDDPTMPFHRGSFRFDDEGLPSKPTTLVKNGVLTDYLYDRVTAMREGKRSNGHGRRESFHCKPIPRMSNLYIAPGQDDPKAILKSLKAGLLVTRMGGGQVNTATGEFVFEVDEGFWVEDGKIKHMVRDANLLGVGPEVLRSIDKVGWDIGWGIGTCGKDGQGVPVGDGQPTIRMPKILVGGRHEE